LRDEGIRREDEAINTAMIFVSGIDAEANGMGAGFQSDFANAAPGDEAEVEFVVLRDVLLAAFVAKIDLSPEPPSS
jgi:hypothetical protein